jgi:hypothetical protein
MANLATDISKARCTDILNEVAWNDEDKTTNEKIIKDASSDLSKYCSFNVLKAVIVLVFPDPDAPDAIFATGCLNDKLRRHILEVSSRI